MAMSAPAARTAAQERVVAAALELFARHGVAGTSLQMIAREIGVTKAAVYHQYRSKDEIVLAAAEAELATLRAVIEAAEAEPSPEEARDTLIAGIVDLAIDRRRTASTIMADPAVARFFHEHDTFRDVMLRMRRLLIGRDTGNEAKVRTAMLIAALSGAAMNPFVAGLDDKALRIQLNRLARRFLELPD